MLNPDDQKAQDALKFIAKQLQINLGVFLISFGDYDAILRKFSPFKDEVDMAIKSLNLKNIKTTSREKTVQLEEKVSVTEDAPIIKIVASTLREAVNLGASDIHFEPFENEFKMRYRIDGRDFEFTGSDMDSAVVIDTRPNPDVEVGSALKIHEAKFGPPFSQGERMRHFVTSHPESLHGVSMPSIIRRN